MPFLQQKKTFHSALLASSLVVLGVLSGCASDLSGHRYSRHEARQTQRVQFGTLISIETVELGRLGIGRRWPLPVQRPVALQVLHFGKGGGKGLSVIAGAVAGYALGNQARKDSHRNHRQQPDHRTRDRRPYRRCPADPGSPTACWSATGSRC